MWLLWPGVVSAPAESSGVTLVPVVSKNAAQSAALCDNDLASAGNDADLVDPSCWDEMDIEEFN